MTNLDRYRADLEALVKRGNVLLLAMYKKYAPDLYEKVMRGSKERKEQEKKNLPDFSSEYQPWYSESLAIITQLLPDRRSDFVRHYEKPRSRKDITVESYRIEDALQGIQVTRGLAATVLASPDAAIPHFQQQLHILESVKRRFESSLFDIRQLLQADLFDSELDAARELLKNGFGRAAGAVAGVVLEKHLGQVAVNHQATTRKSHPTISDFNDLLKSAGVLDTPNWRQIQRLGDLRNLCDHNKHRDPTKEEVTELIDGVEKVMKTLF